MRVTKCCLNGQSCFVKSNGMQSLIEHLAYEIYRIFEIKVPQSYLLDINNDIGIVTIEIKGKVANDPFVLIGNKDITDGFFVDAFLANWDVIGLAYDNIILTEDKQAFRIDPGGALTYRALGDRKGDKFEANPKELYSLRDISIAPQAGRIFSQMTDTELKSAAIVFQKVSWEKIENTILAVKKDTLENFQQLKLEIEQDFNEILSKLKVRYSKVVEFIQNKDFNGL